MTNSAAVGYMILAAQMIKLDRTAILQLERAMGVMFDEHPEEEAEEAYWSYN